MDFELILIGTLASLIAGLSTAIGALPVFWKKEISDKSLDLLLGFAAGVMLAASAFSLLVPALNLEEGGGVWIVSLGVLAGAGFIDLVDRWAPHEHFVCGKEGIMTKKLAAIWLFVIAITIHNFPEGMVTFAGTLKDVELGFLLAFAIALHNIPEGIAVAIPIYSSTKSRKKAFFWSFFSGISEPIGALVFGLILFPFINDFLLGAMLAIVGGFMVYISLDELLPASRIFGNEHLSILGIIAGMILMFLSLALL